MKVIALLAATAVAAASAKDCNLLELPAVFGNDLVAEVSECTGKAGWQLLTLQDPPKDPKDQIAVCQYCGDVFPKIQAKDLPACDLPFPSKPIPLKTLIDKTVEGCAMAKQMGGGAPSNGSKTNSSAKATQTPAGNSTAKATQLPKANNGTKKSNESETDLPEPTTTVPTTVSSGESSAAAETKAPAQTKASNGTDAQKKEGSNKSNAGALSLSAATAVLAVVAAYFN